MSVLCPFTDEEILELGLPSDDELDELVSAYFTVPNVMLYNTSDSYITRPATGSCCVFCAVGPPVRDNTYGCSLYG
jgi:hypothetical protein